MIKDDFAVKISRQHVLKLLRYDKNKTVLDDSTKRLIETLVRVSRKLIIPKAIYRDFPIKRINKNAVILEGTNYDLLGKSTVHRLLNAKKVTLAVCTIGQNLEREIKFQSDHGAMSKAVILDAIGSVAAEFIINEINNTISAKAHVQGYKTTMRFSPGYGDWQLKEQKGLLKLLNASSIGISLDKSFLMCPQKSVSAAIGWIL